MIDVEVAASILDAVGAAGAADHLRVVAMRIASERSEAFFREQQEEMERFDAKLRAERQWIRRVPCPRCSAPAGSACKLPSGTRADNPHKDRKIAAGPLPAVRPA